MPPREHLFFVILVVFVSTEANNVTNLHEEWAAHVTESPVAAVTLNHTHVLHLRPSPLRSSPPSSSSTQNLSPERNESTSQLAGEPNSSTTDVTPTTTVTSSTTTTPTTTRDPSLKANRGVKNVELITRRPSEEKPKRRKIKGKPITTSTEGPQNDSPQQESQTTWAHLPDGHQQRGQWVAETKYHWDDSITFWGVRIQPPREPDFKVARTEWGKYWPLHIYCAGGIFAFLAIVNLWQLLSKLFSATSLLMPKGRFICVTFLMLITCSFRATFLLVDPYNANGTFRDEILPGLIDMPLFCIATSFAIVFTTLLNSTGVQLTSKLCRSSSCVLAFVYFLFFIGGTGVLSVAGLVPPEWKLIQLVPTLSFVVWTLLMCGCFLSVFKKVQRAAVRKHGESLRATFTKLHIEGADLPRRLPRPTLCVAVRITLINVVLLLAINGLTLYGMIAVLNIFSTASKRRLAAEPWPWWSYQLIMRMLEATVSVLITYTALQSENDVPRDEESTEQQSSGCCAWKCCRRNDVVHNYESCSDIAYGFRNENFNTSLDFSNVAGGVTGVATNRSHNAWSRGQTTAPLTFQHGRSEENTANKSYARNSLLSHPIQALSSLGSGRQSKFATNSTVESSQRHSTILFRDKLRRSAPPQLPEAAQLNQVAVEDNDGDDESIRAQMGSRVHSITEEDAMLLNSPFFPRFKRSHCSSLDNSIDVSSDQLSSLGQSGVEFVPHHHRRTMAGSTCSSESAANSFDVAFFLNSNPHLDHTQAVAAQREFMERLVRHEQERHLKRSSQQDDRKRFFEEYDRIQEEIRRERAMTSNLEPRSISPIVSARSSCHKAGLARTRHDSTRSEEILEHQPELHQYPQQHQLHQHRANQQNLQKNHHPPHQHLQQQESAHQQPPSVHKMSLDLAPSGVVGTHPTQSRVIGNTADEDITPDSAVYLDLHMSPSDESPAGDLHIIHNSFNSLKRASRSFLNRINSTFSLSNKSYAPLESADECVTYFGADCGSLDKGQRLRAAKSADVLASADHENLCGSLQHGDSGLLVEENSQRSSVLCDSACQTEPLCT